MLEEKHRRLRDLLRGMGSCIVAYSGGTDSTLLAAVAHSVLGGRALAATAVSATYTAHERQQARELSRRLGLSHREVETAESGDENFLANPPERCYFCKLALYAELEKLRVRTGAACIVDGTTTDDFSDYRPGMRATREKKVRSPLAEAGFSKDDVRALSRQLNLPTANREASPCLATRIPYGTPITPERLHAVEQAETVLRSAGFTQCRLRHHGAVARIEVAPEEIARFADPQLREHIVSAIKALGFTWVAVDLAGYRTGSMNEALDDSVTKT